MVPNMMQLGLYIERHNVVNSIANILVKIIYIVAILHCSWDIAATL